MDYTALRNVLSTSPYSGLSNADAAAALNTNTTQVNRGIITVSYFATLTLPALATLLAANKGDTIRAPYEGLLAVLQVPGVTTVDMSNPTIQGAIQGLAIQSIGGYTSQQAQNAIYNTVSVAVATVGEEVTEDDVEMARR